MAKYVEIATGIEYEPQTDYVNEQFANDPRFKIADEPKKSAARRSTKAKTE